MDLSAGVNLSDVGASKTCSARMVWVLRTLCLTALGISVYLAWTALNMLPVYGCGGGDVMDCGHVLTSKWSKVLGLPVSVPACGLYLTLLGILCVIRRSAPPAFTQMLWNAMTAGTIIAGLSAVWYVGLQIFVLKHLCPYCLAVHACGILLAALMLRNPLTTFRQKTLMASIGVTAVGIMMTIQIRTEPADNFEIVRYDDPESADVSTTEGDGSSEAEFFAAPGDVFDAPGEVFEAPGQEAGSSQAQTPLPVPSKETKKAESIQPVASNLLMILPPRILMLSNLPGLFPQEPAAELDSEDPADEATPEKTTDGDSAGKAAEPVKPERRLITVAGNRITLDVRQWPLLGKPDARYVFVEMFDYTCPHCRNTHAAIKGALDEFGDDLAIVALPVPLDPACNPDASGNGHAGSCELSRIAVAVWRVAPGKFREFHDWLFASSRTAASARAYAEQLVGKSAFALEFGSPTPGEYIKRHIQLYGKVGQGSVPKLIFPKSMMTGEVNSRTTLCNTIRSELKDVAAK